MSSGTERHILVFYCLTNYSDQNLINMFVNTHCWKKFMMFPSSTTLRRKWMTRMRTRTTVTLKARKQRRKTWTAWLVSLQIFVTDYSIWQLEIHSDKNNQKDMCQSRIQDGLVTPSACLLMYQNFESLREGCMIIQNTNLKLGLVNILKLYTFKSEFHALVPYNLYVVLFWHVLHQRKCYWPSHSPMHCNGLNFNIFCKKNYWNIFQQN